MITSPDRGRDSGIIAGQEAAARYFTLNDKWGTAVSGVGRLQRQGDYLLGLYQEAIVNRNSPRVDIESDATYKRRKEHELDTQKVLVRLTGGQDLGELFVEFVATRPTLNWAGHNFFKDTFNACKKEYYKRRGYYDGNPAPYTPYKCQVLHSAESVSIVGNEELRSWWQYNKKDAALDSVVANQKNQYKLIGGTHRWWELYFGHNRFPTRHLTDWKRNCYELCPYLLPPSFGSHASQKIEVLLDHAELRTETYPHPLDPSSSSVRSEQISYQLTSGEYILGDHRVEALKVIKFLDEEFPLRAFLDIHDEPTAHLLPG